MSECLTCETAFFVKKLIQCLYSCEDLSDFDQISRSLWYNIVIKELQMVFWLSTVINSNGNMKELERKIQCEKLMFW